MGYRLIYFLPESEPADGRNRKKKAAVSPNSPVRIQPVDFIRAPLSRHSMTRGFYIGRFQPYHEGHHAMIDRIREEIDELVVGIGSADQSHTARNPFTAGERIMMITKALAEFDMTTYAVPIEDLNRNSVWVSHVQSMSPRFEIAYSNNPLVVRLFEEADIEVRQSPMFHREEFEGTEVRERMASGDDWESLVPRTVIEVIDEIGGVDRLQQITDTDANDADTPGEFVQNGDTK